MTPYVEAFLAASRNGDFDALLAVLNPDVALPADHCSGELDRQRRFKELGRWHQTLRERARGATGGAEESAWLELGGSEHDKPERRTKQTKETFGARRTAGAASDRDHSIDDQESQRSAEAGF